MPLRMRKTLKFAHWCVFNLSKWTRLPAVGRPNLILGFDSMKVHTQEYAAGSKEKKRSKETPLTQILTANWKFFYFLRMFLYVLKQINYVIKIKVIIFILRWLGDS